MDTVATDRVTALATPALSVELVRFGVSRAGVYVPPPPHRQLLFPLAGAYRWHVGNTTAVVDPNQVAFIRDDEASTETSAAPTAVTCLILNVAPVLERRLWPHADPFATRAVRMSPALQARYSWFANAVRVHGAHAPEQCEEHALALIVAATREACSRISTATPRAARRLAERTKLLLADRERLVSLVELADLLAVSPAYLTDAFRRAEGVPVVRYQLQLRVMRALRELPMADDLATLALDLGFASHSHFATAFREATGLTPSRYRALVRGPGIESSRKQRRRISPVMSAWPANRSAST
jgi:AraC family transcriptional regulator